MSYKSQFKNYGLGLGLRKSIRTKTLDYAQEKNSLIQWLEIVPENFIAKGGIHSKRFQDLINSKIPLIPHGVNLSIGTASGEKAKPSFDAYLIDQLKELFQTIRPPWFSDHLSCTCINGFYLQDLIPVPRTHEAIEVITTNIKFLEDQFQLPFLIENPSFYSTLIEPEISELDFINQILNRANCGMLLDVNNVYVNSINHGDYQAADFLRGLDLDRVVQVHIAGHLEDYSAWLSGKKLKLLDTHGEGIKKEVYDILKDLLSLTEIKAILLERDSNFPDFQEIIDELKTLSVIVGSVIASPEGARQSNSTQTKSTSTTSINKNTSLKKLQCQILNYFTGKTTDSKVLSPTTIEDLSIYKSLVLSGMQGLISKIFARTYLIIEKDFSDIITDYLHQHPSRSAIYNQLCKEFPDYLASKNFKDKYNYPSYLAELALYEWTDIEIYNLPDQENSESLLKPIHKILKFKYPISQIIEFIKEKQAEENLTELRETDIEEEAEVLFVYRDEESFQTKFLLLSSSSLFVVENLEKSNSVEKVFNDFCLEFGVEPNEQVKIGFEGLLTVIARSEATWQSNSTIARI